MKIYRAGTFSEVIRLATEWTEERIIVQIPGAPCVVTGQLATLDRAACEKHGLEVGQGEYNGGTIVCMPGDLMIYVITWGSSELVPQMMDRAALWLAGKGIDIRQDENDLLARPASATPPEEEPDEWRKVGSWARAGTIKGWCQSGIHFGTGAMDLELVREICTKPMIKEPGALSVYGITAEMIWNEIKGLLE